jgi:hypothetical protein
MTTRANRLSRSKDTKQSTNERNKQQKQEKLKQEEEEKNEKNEKREKEAKEIEEKLFLQRQGVGGLTGQMRGSEELTRYAIPSLLGSYIRRNHMDGTPPLPYFSSSSLSLPLFNILSD